SLSGRRISDATSVLLDDPAMTARIERAADPAKDRVHLAVALTLSPETRLGIHRVTLATPLGTTGAVTFDVGGWPEVPEKEPNDDPLNAPLVALPASLTGAMDRE